MRYFCFIGLLILSLLPVTLHAQTDEPLVTIISMDSTFTGTISNEATFDWWKLSLGVDDRIRVVMRGQDGLAPRVGVLDEGLTLLVDSGGGEPDGLVVIDFVAPRSGEFTIVTSRDGASNGTTVGGYTLQVLQLNAPVVDPFRETTLNCDDTDVEIANALTLFFTEDESQSSELSIVLYGLDGFQPTLRVTLLESDNFRYCLDTGVDSFLTDLQLPDEGPINDLQQVTNTLSSAGEVGELQVNVGSLDAVAGRFVLVIDGLGLDQPGDIDQFEVALGPLSRETDLLIYAIGDKTTRLDPYLRWIDDDANTRQRCDDAGVRDCADMPAITSFQLQRTPDHPVIQGGRFDPGILLNPGNPDKQFIQIGAFGERSAGNYTLIVFGTFPGRGD